MCLAHFRVCAVRLTSSEEKDPAHQSVRWSWRSPSPPPSLPGAVRPMHDGGTANYCSWVYASRFSAVFGHDHLLFRSRYVHRLLYQSSSSSVHII